MKTIDELCKYLNTCPQGEYKWDEFHEPVTDHEMEAYWLGIRQGFGCASGVIRLKSPALEAGMRGTLRWRWSKGRNYWIMLESSGVESGDIVDGAKLSLTIAVNEKGARAITKAISTDLTAVFEEELDENT